MTCRSLLYMADLRIPIESLSAAVDDKFVIFHAELNAHRPIIVHNSITCSNLMQYYIIVADCVRVLRSSYSIQSTCKTDRRHLHIRNCKRRRFNKVPPPPPRPTAPMRPPRMIIIRVYIEGHIHYINCIDHSR